MRPDSTAWANEGFQYWGGILNEGALSKFLEDPTEMTDSKESQTFVNKILWQNMENRESISCFIHVLRCANIGWMLHNNTVAVLTAAVV